MDDDLSRKCTKRMTDSKIESIAKKKKKKNSSIISWILIW